MCSSAPPSLSLNSAALLILFLETIWNKFNFFLRWPRIFEKRVENFPVALLFSQAPFPGLVISLCPCTGVHDCSLQGIWQTAAGEADCDVWFPGLLSITLWSCDREGWEVGSLYSESYGCMKIIRSRGAGGQNRDSPLEYLHHGLPCCLSATRSSASHREFPEHWGSYWR